MKTHETPEDRQARILRVIRRYSDEGGINLEDLVQQLNGIGKTTARRDLQDLENAGKIEVRIVNKQGWKRFLPKTA